MAITLVDANTVVKVPLTTVMLCPENTPNKHYGIIIIVAAVVKVT